MGIKNRVSFILITFTLCISFLYRYINILQNASYWNDEINVAIYARALLEEGKPVTPNGYSTGLYQLAMYYTTAASFKLFGITEFAGRLPSILAGTLLTIAVYICTKKLFEKNAALIAAFLAGFLQIQLAWSTQLRPYIWLQFFTVLIVYFLYKFLINNKKFIDKNVVTAGMFSVLAILFHAIGIMNIFIIGFCIVYKAIQQKKRKYLLGSFFFLLIIFVTTLLFASFNFQNLIQIVKIFNFDILHYRIYLTHHYLWLLIGAGVGVYAIWKKNKPLAYLFSFSISIIFFLAIFKISSQYVRYSLPAFPIMYILFGNGLVSLISKVKTYIPSKLSTPIASILILGFFFIFPLYKGKIVLVPQKYYSINADMRENPLPNYKSAFEKISTLIKDKDNVIFIDTWNDRAPWYLPGQEYIFINNYNRADIDPVYGEKVIRTTRAFKNEKKRYASGIVLVENWESLAPLDLKHYIEKNLRHEFDQETVLGNEKDPWSISIYSWGIHDAK